MTRNNYTGYVPQTADRFPQHSQPPQLPSTKTTAHLDVAHLSKPALLILLPATLLFLFLATTIGLNLDCRLALCNKLDRSTTLPSVYLYHVYDFLAPLPAIWTCMTVALSALLIALLMYLYQARQPIPDHPTLHLIAALRTAAHTFHLHQLPLLLPLLAVLLLVGLASSWRAALAFLIGLLSAHLAHLACTVIATRLTSRILAKLQPRAYRFAMRTSAIIALSTTSITLVALAAAYLVLRDVRALPAFVLAACLVAMLARQTGGSFAAAAGQANAALLMRATTAHTASATAFPNAYGLHPAVVAQLLGVHLASVAAVTPDLLAALAAAVVAAALSAASLPYFYASRYALCVFNHLDLDSTCAAFRAPTVKQSLAASLCRRDGFHEQYPLLGMWESNSAFVALPFIVAVVGLMATVVSLLLYYVPKNGRLADDEREQDHDGVVSSLKRAMVAHVVVAAVIAIAACAAVCWGMFGSNSDFYKAITTQVEKFNLPVLDNMNVNQVCRPADPEDGQGRTEIPLLTMSIGRYMPFDAFGNAFPPPQETAARLFACIVVGLVGGLIIGAVTVYSTVSKYRPGRRVASGAELGSVNSLMDAFGIALYGSAIPLGIVVAILAGANKLFGVYGVGMSAVGMTCMVSMMIALDAFGSVTESVDSIAHAVGISGESHTTYTLLGQVGLAAVSMTKGVTNACAMLAAHALLNTIIQEAGLVPGTRQLGGSLFDSPVRHISDVDTLNLLDILVVIGALIGLALPFLLTNLSLSAAARTAVSLTLCVRRQLLCARTRPSDATETDANTENVHTCAKESAIHSITPMFTAIMAPLMIGFGLGQRALISLATSVIPSGFVLATSLTMCGCALRLSKQRCGWAQGAVAGVYACAGPLVNVGIKAVPAVAALTASVMAVDGARAWIGAIVFAAWLVVVSGVHARLDARESAMWRALGDTNRGLRERTAGVNGRTVSPFFEQGPSLDRTGIHPRSELAIARADVAHDEALVRLVGDDE